MQALYDYIPTEASPNDDIDEEIPFLQGEIVKVFSIDDDGFALGEKADGTRGLMPSNFLEEISEAEALTVFGRSAAAASNGRRPEALSTPRQQSAGATAASSATATERLSHETQGATAAPAADEAGAQYFQVRSADSLPTKAGVGSRVFTCRISVPGAL